MRLCGTVFSKTLDMDTNITVVTPNVLTLNKEYNVVYLLHGLCGNSKTWLDYSMLSVYAAEGTTIYVMPEVARSFYSDMKYGLKYLTYVTEELPEICKSVFKISATREKTAIIGCSMGGYGALKCALIKPEQYGMCAAFSSACLLLKDGLAQMRSNDTNREYINVVGERLISDFRAIFGETYEWNPKDDIIELAKEASKNGSCPKLYLTCGTQDPFYNDHLKFCSVLKDMDVDFEFEQWEAQHDFFYFDSALKKAIDKFLL